MSAAKLRPPSVPPPSVQAPVFVSPVFVSTAVLIAAMLTAVPTAIPTSLQIFVLLAVVVLLGVPHGALDPWIAEKAGLIETRRAQMTFHLLYIAGAAAVVAIWSILPLAALIGFLLISAWHFSGDWSDVFGVGMRWISGGLLLWMPIVFHTESVAEIFAMLSEDRGGRLAHWLHVPTLVVLLVAMLVIAVALQRHKWWAVVEFGALVVLAATAPPLVYFAVYFCLLHSPNHLLGYFALAGPALRGRLIKMTLLYSIGSLAVAAPVVWLWPDGGANSLIARVIFIGLAALTVPHMALLWVATRRQARVSGPHQRAVLPSHVRGD
jgi:beta-carotene 15,15'-dioxygenase